ncbi:MAG: GtrA family protein [Atopobiaceae bacterium]|nr:GtrA family protein [Atopobiaceae bacterium]
MEAVTQFVLYVVVGGIATVVEWACFWVFNRWMHYTLATALAFVVSTFANWLAGRILVFKESDQSLVSELAKIYGASVAGLLMNLAIMWVAVEQFGVKEMIAKIIATGIVFFWNFLIRKLLIYRS